MIGPFLASILAEIYGYSIAYLLCGSLCLLFVVTWALVCGTEPNHAGKKFDLEDLELEQDEPDALETESEISQQKSKFGRKSMMTGYYSLLSKAGT